MPKDITLSDGQVVKKPSKTGETLLSVLSVLGDIGGKIIFGNDVGLGQPFALGAQFMKNKREGKQMMEILGETPHTAPIKDMIEQGMMAGEQGGLLNQAGIDPQTLQDGSGSTQMEQVPSDPSQQLPIAPGASQPQLPNPASSQGAIDYQSDSFMRRVAAINPELAEKVMQSRMTGDENNPLMEQLKLMTMANALQNYETPSMKRQAAVEDRNYLTSERIGMQRDAQTEARKEAAQIKKEMWTPAEDKEWNEFTDSEIGLRKINAEVESGKGPTIASALASTTPGTNWLYQTVVPGGAEQSDFMKEVNTVVMKAVKDQSGVQYGFKELQWVKSTQPNTWDTPEAYKIGLRRLRLSNMFIRMNRIENKVLKADSLKPALERGISKEQLVAYNNLNKQLSQIGRVKGVTTASVLESPKNAALLQQLGI